MKCLLHPKAIASFLALPMLCIAISVNAANWSTNEIHLQYGELDVPFTASAERDTFIITFQHASGWKYGDNFFFIDHLSSSGSSDAGGEDGEDGDEFYGEWYSNFSLGAITGKALKFGPVKDIGLIAGFNFAPEVDSLWYLPGVRLALDLPGFAFANLDTTAYIHEGDGFIKDEDDGYMVDFNWGYPFKVGNLSFSFEGHMEYINRDGQILDIFEDGSLIVDTKLDSWILAQPQLRLDLGEQVYGTANELFVGIEYQYWKNKLGDGKTDESVVQALVVWRF